VSLIQSSTNIIKVSECCIGLRFVSPLELPNEGYTGSVEKFRAAWFLNSKVIEVMMLIYC